MRIWFEFGEDVDVVDDDETQNLLDIDECFSITSASALDR